MITINLVKFCFHKALLDTVLTYKMNIRIPSTGERESKIILA